ncbi:hypothetical protein RUND412_005453 [Rhizina undulata]
MVAQLAVPITGTLYWKLVFSYDNSTNSAGITHTYKAKIFESYSSKDFNEKVTESTRQQIRTHKVGVNASAAYKVVSAGVDYSYENSKEIRDFLRVATTRETEIKRESEQEETREYVIGPNSKLELYQLYFKAPGIEYACNALSTTKKPDQTITIGLTVEPIEFISNLVVKYGSKETDAPSDRVRALNRQLDDINSGFQGSYVWLVPEYTQDVSQACTGFDIFIQASADSGKSDLAKGANGLYRYIVPIKNPKEKKKITEVALLRSENWADIKSAPGYDGITPDINRDRKKDWLYVVWKSVQTY